MVTVPIVFALLIFFALLALTALLFFCEPAGLEKEGDGQCPSFRAAPAAAPAANHPVQDCPQHLVIADYLENREAEGW